MAPLRIMSFDIECTTRGDEFPTQGKQPIIQISNVVKVQGESEIFARNVFTLKNCAPIVGSKVQSFETEMAMLRAWKDFLIEVDPDILTGYNI